MQIRQSLHKLLPCGLFALTLTSGSELFAQTLFGPGPLAQGVGDVQVSDYPGTIGFHWPGVTIQAISVGKEDTLHNTFRFRAGNPSLDGPSGIDVEGSAYVRGSIGIGTLNPASRLEVNGDIRLTPGTNAGIIFSDGTVIRSAPTGSSGTGAPAAGQTNTLPSSGNVGIGTTNPSSPFTVVANNGNSQPGDTATFSSGVGAASVIGNQVNISNDLSWGLLAGFDGPGVSGSQYHGANAAYLINVRPGALNFGASNDVKMTINPAGNVGIGTTNPSAALEVNGSVKITSGSNGALTFGDGSVQTSAFNPLQGLNAGTSTSAGRITVGSSAPDQQGNASQGIVFVDTVNGIPQQFQHAAIYKNGSSGFNGDLVFATDGDNSPATALSERMRILFNGNVGIGTTTPGEKLELNGNLKLAANSGAHLVFADGTQQSTAWTGTLTGGDHAESVDVTGERKDFEPGDLLVIDPNHAGSFLKASQPYSTLVGGVYATKPGVTGRRQARDKPQDSEVPMAMVGIVPTKVSAENGAVHVGDLLVSSSTPGYAMKGTERNQLTGAVLGKALGTLDAGKGLIEVLISLQ